MKKKIITDVCYQKGAILEFEKKYWVVLSVKEIEVDQDGIETSHPDSSGFFAIDYHNNVREATPEEIDNYLEAKRKKEAEYSEIIAKLLSEEQKDSLTGYDNYVINFEGVEYTFYWGSGEGDLVITGKISGDRLIIKAIKGEIFHPKGFKLTNLETSRKKLEETVNWFFKVDEVNYQFLTQSLPRNTSLTSDQGLFGAISHDKKSPVAQQPDKYEYCLIGNSPYYKCNAEDLEALYEYYYQKNKEEYTAEKTLAWLEKYGEDWKSESSLEKAKKKLKDINFRGCQGTHFRSWVIFRKFPEYL